MKKFIYADINAMNEKEEQLHSLLERYEADGADGFYIYDFSKDERSREQFIHLVRNVMHEIELPFYIGICPERFEDIKKALYTGASRVYIRFPWEEFTQNEQKESDSLLWKSVAAEGINRFGTEKIGVEIDTSKGEFNLTAAGYLNSLEIKHVILKHVDTGRPLEEKMKNSGRSFCIRDSLTRNDLAELMMLPENTAVITNFYEGRDIRRAKLALKQQGIEVQLTESSLCFSEFKLDSAGLIPAVVQDYRTNEVLMLAYMNEEAYNKTIETGKMTYYSRSRNELWCKGDTSGHFQYVRELTIDCDKDTILAKVKQVGTACHTGNRSCFFTELAPAVSQGSEEADILQAVYRTVADRKKHPKEGSYTNYLFDKGIDKILKKCGEEATEIVIAAKNPDSSELKYEIADYLYHMTVLMVECGLNWEDVLRELADRH